MSDLDLHEEPQIKQIDESSIRQIVAGQAIFDLSSAIKELIENSLDAGAKNITVRLYRNGIDKIQVEDDGVGVPLSSRPLMATKHATSKLAKFEDLYAVSSSDVSDQQRQLGFRGEALFCLANLSEKLVVTTKTAKDRVGQKLHFKQDGSLDKSSVTNLPRKIGTTVTVEHLFHALPVRRMDFTKRIKSQRAKMLKIIQGYAIMCLGVKFTLMDIKGKMGTSSFKQEVKLATSVKTQKLEDTVSSVMGSKFLAGLCPIKVDLTDMICTPNNDYDCNDSELDSNVAIGNSQEKNTEPMENSLNDKADSQKSNLSSKPSSSAWKIEGLVSKSPSISFVNNTSNTSKNQSHGIARELQFFSLNDRLVDLPKMSRVLSDAWREFESTHFKRPACILSFHLPNNIIDVNLSPDKREVLLEQEDVICKALREALVNIWKDQSKGTFVTNEVENLSQEKIQSQLKQFTSPIFTKENGREKNCAMQSKVITPVPDNKSQEDCAALVQSLSSKIIELDCRKSSDDDDSTPAPLANEHNDENLAVQKDSSAGTKPLPSSPPRMSQQLHSDKDHREWIKIRNRFNNIGECAASPQVEDINHLEDNESNNIPTNRRLRMGEFKPKPASLQKPTSSSISEAPSPKRIKLSFQEQVKMLQKFKLGSEVSNTSSSSSMTQHHDVKKSKSLDNEEKQNENNESPRSVKPNKQKQSSSKDVRRDIQSISPPKKQASKTLNKNEVVWDMFSGTEDIIQQARSARKYAKKYRKDLQQLKIKRQQLHKENNEDEGDDVTTQHEENEHLSSDDILPISEIVRLTKDDFLSMEIIGQFNLGFILARCRNHHLWMFDQHASDEKFNFERLWETTVVHEQTLIAPLPLELSVSEENCIMDHMDVFRMNGFRFAYDVDKPPRHRLSLTALPHSGSGGDGKKAVQFGKEDVSALCAMLGADGGSNSTDFSSGSGTGADGSGAHSNHAVRRYAGSIGGISSNAKLNLSTGKNQKHGVSIIRLPKAVAMFASRACRGSIMIGKALSQKEMESVVRKLHDVDQPWDCPHGRPTMRHVKDILGTLIQSEISAAKHAASPSLVVLSQEMDDI